MLKWIERLRPNEGNAAQRAAVSHARARACVLEALEPRRLFNATTADSGSAPTAQSDGQLAAAAARPSVNFTNPPAGATNVRRDIFVAADVLLPNGGIRLATLDSTNVYLTRAADGRRVNAVLNSSGGGDVIVLRPEAVLDATTTYRFHVTPGLQDVEGEAFLPFEMTFTTGTETGGSSSNIKFQQSHQADGYAYTTLAIGPDRRLYAGTFDGRIIRWQIKGDGTLGGETIFETLRTANNGSRSISGILFDPDSTASNPVLWVAHSTYGLANAPDWAGKISVLRDDEAGNDLGKISDRIINLPRSNRDHMTNQLAWGPDGALYFNQGSSSAMGAADVAWGSRNEHLLTAAILRVDVNKLPSSRALNVKTEEGGTYDPRAADAAVTVYATGVRNAYNVVWHSNGHLYAPGNGSASGGNTPAGDGAPALTAVGTSQHDYLFRIQKGGYYGHPNPLNGEYVMGGGNPTAGVDPGEVIEYPVGTQPDENYRGYIFDFGDHISPNGAIEYRNNKAFGGALAGKLLITRYSGPDDIIVLSLDDEGNVSQDTTGITGLTNLNNPLDLVEDPLTGNIYVAEFGPKDRSDLPGGRRVILLRPEEPLAGGGKLISADVDARARGTTTVITEGSAYDVMAGGWNIAGDADGFRFLYEQRSGDFDLMVQVQEMSGQGARAIARAGLMARHSLSADSRNVFSGVTMGNGYRFTARTGVHQNTQIMKAPGSALPNCWVRLKREGNHFTGYYSSDGVTWHRTGRMTLALPEKVYVGLAASSGSAVTGDTLTARFRGLRSYTTPAAAMETAVAAPTEGSFSRALITTSDPQEPTPSAWSTLSPENDWATPMAPDTASKEELEDSASTAWRQVMLIHYPGVWLV